MLYGPSAIKASGVLAEHALAMAKVAHKTLSIIMIRGMGEYVKRLLSNGYSTKGFLIKNKTCNFGPMAGFVLLNPEFSRLALLGGKRKKVSERIKITSARLAGATPRALVITDNRRRWLEQQNYIRRLPNESIGWTEKFEDDGKRYWKYEALFDNIKVHNESEYIKNYVYFLRETDNKCWFVYYKHKNKPYLPTMVKALVDPLWNANYDTTPIQGQTSTNVNVMVPKVPPGHQYGGQPYAPDKEYLKATSGDYDLFACWQNTKYGEQRFRAGDIPYYRRKYYRPAGPTVIHDIDRVHAVEHPSLGNVSGYIYGMIKRINQQIARDCNGPYKQTMVHHNDECGRPAITDIEYNFLAIFPKDYKLFKGAQYVTICNLEDFEALINEANDNGFRVELNPGWLPNMTGGDVRWLHFQIVGGISFADAFTFYQQYDHYSGCYYIFILILVRNIK